MAWTNNFISLLKKQYNSIVQEGLKAADEKTATSESMLFAKWGGWIRLKKEKIYIKIMWNLTIS